MTHQQIKNKISELEQWLQFNHSHPNRTIVEQDLRKLKEQLNTQPTDEFRGN
jgi:hypothetical protein